MLLTTTSRVNISAAHDFSFCVSGYGNLTPKTPWGKIATVSYALVGIPLMLLYMANSTFDNLAISAPNFTDYLIISS